MAMQENREATHITSFDQLKQYAMGNIVELPGFGEGQPLVVRMKRPSLLKLAESGMIPNTLLAKAGEMFSSGSRAFKDESGNMLSEVYSILDVIARASLVEPTMDDIEEAGLTLTDEQLMAIFNYSQNGVKALEQFRRQREVSERNRGFNKNHGKAK